MPLYLHPDAEAEFSQAIAWYAQRGVALAIDFALAVDAGIEAVRQSPLRFPAVHGSRRRFLLDRFPYGIFYDADGADIHIVAIYHLSRNPSGWMHRR